MYHEASLALILGDRSQEQLSIMTVMCAAMSNMCRDEITGILKTKLDIVFGSSFNTNGLGGVLTVRGHWSEGRAVSLPHLCGRLSFPLLWHSQPSYSLMHSLPNPG